MINKTTQLSTLFLLVLTIAFIPDGLSSTLSTDEVRWLNRINYGINSQIINSYHADGKNQFLDKQLSNKVDSSLPDHVKKKLSELLIENKNSENLASDIVNEMSRLRHLSKQEKTAGRKSIHKLKQQPLNEAIERHLFRALYANNQLKEQLTWFWLNHFSVFGNKGGVHWAVADYEDKAVRPYVLGKFKDLLIATLRHPAMLVYLDNSHNVAGKINENFARELLELHTLGVDGGYSQQDVQELARILTGLGVNWTNKHPKIKNNLKSFYVRDGNFEFNPNQHDFGDKAFLGKTITGAGLAEIEQVANLLSRHPSTARFISKKLAVYFVSDTPSAALVEQMAKTYTATDGDIAAILRVAFDSKEFAESLGKKVSDPMHYIVATLRFVYDGYPIADVTPVMQWLKTLDEPLYGHLTPDGYGMTEKDWVSPSQLTKHFEIAKQIVSNRLSDDPKAFNLKTQKLSESPLYKVIEPTLSEKTKAALAKAVSPEEWNLFLLSAPEFAYR